MKGVLVQLFDETGAAYASGTDIAVMWFDSELPPDLGMIKGQSAIATTDASGWLSLDLDNVTGLAIGDFGFLVCYKLDGGDHRASPTFCSKMEVTSMTGTTVLGPLTDYVRNPDWPAQVAMVNGVQKFTGLLAVFDHDSNFIALQASGNYTVNWGDGGGDFNVTGGVQAERNISYASVSGTIVGTSKAVAVTFTDTGDTVNRTAHGYQNGQRVNFATIVTTTGISTHTTYFVVGRTANTFQVASTIGGSALTLTTDGSGTVYTPEYKVALVTVTPQAGQNLTAFSLQKKHSQSGLSTYGSPWLDIAINSTLLTSLAVSFATPITPLTSLEVAALGENAVSDTGNMFNLCPSLRSLPRLNIASSTSCQYMFADCQSLQAIPWIDTGACLSFFNMFKNAKALQAMPLFDVSAATTLGYMFYACSALQVVPLFNIGAAQLTYMFQNCTALQTIPLLDTSTCTALAGFFAGCSALKEVPPLDTSSATDMSSFLSGCASIQTVPLLDTSLVTNLNTFFAGCTSLVTVPALKTTGCSSFTQTFFNCPSLQYVAPLDVSGASATGLDWMFNLVPYSTVWCQNLSSARLNGTAVNVNYQGCRLSAAALDDIYTGLATVVGKTITVTGNYGTTGDTPSIATSKGWTVTG